MACVGKQVHTCSCKVGVHAVDACCCGEPTPAAAGQVGPLSCDGDSGTEMILGFGRHLLTPPSRASGVPLPLPLTQPSSFPAVAESPLSPAWDTLTPPPKPTETS